MVFELRVTELHDDGSSSVVDEFVFTRSVDEFVSMMGEPQWQHYLGVVPGYVHRGVSA